MHVVQYFNRLQLIFSFLYIISHIGKPWKTQLSTIIKHNLWMYKMNTNTIEMITEKVKLFYFNNEDLTEEASPKIVQVRIYQR